MRFLRTLGCLVLLVASAACGGDDGSPQGGIGSPTGGIRSQPPTGQAGGVVLASDQFSGERVDVAATCDGEDLSPGLSIEASRRAESFVVTVVDHTAPSGPFIHWILANVPGPSVSFGPGEVPPGAIEGINDFGDVGYGGPCPPEGGPPHEYTIRAYAIEAGSDLADLRTGATIDDVIESIECCIFDDGTLVGSYSR